MRKKTFIAVMLAALVLFASIAAATNIKFGWDTYADKADIAGGGFALYYSDNQAGPYSKIATINDVNATTYDFLAIESVGLTASSYWFALRAFRAGGSPESANSTPIQWTKPTTTTTSVMPTTTTTSMLPTTTTTSIKPVVPVTGLKVITTN